MNIERAIDTLLSEGIGKRTLLHFTDPSYLKDIFKSKMLKGFKYKYNNSGELKTVATVRPGMANKKNVDKLSHASGGGIKIIIDAEKLSDSLRGVKIKPFAEFPMSAFERIRIHSGKTKQEMQAVINSFNKDVGANYRKFYKGKTSEEISIANKRIRALLSPIQKKHNLDNTTFSMIRNKYMDYLDTIVNREGEERIVLKGEGIPLDSKYMKFQIMKKSDEKIREELSYDPDLPKIIMKNKGMFIQDENFDRFVKGNKDED
jgi:hypothetical protein